MAHDGTASFEVKLIHIGRQALGLDDETYRAMLANLCGGKTTSKALLPRERQVVLSHMKARGFELKPRRQAASNAANGWQREPQMVKLRKLWYLLADAGAVQRPADKEACNAAIEIWARGRVQHLERMRFATGMQMSKLIEEATAWARRVGCDIERG
ncbi:regulatory protein GemA [Rubrivivax gelatinosus]|uniref:regulatory protein GemA n=1 Tax=Rubrivivax gelatinosus TaxID=28068 RepID=UPI001902F2A0|nr:regulatory protein GemA [Rubrivivax gelatinosus]